MSFYFLICASKSDISWKKKRKFLADEQLEELIEVLPPEDNDIEIGLCELTDDINLFLSSEHHFDKSLETEKNNSEIAELPAENWKVFQTTVAQTSANITLDDGNCAINTVVLGVCELALADKLPTNDDFYEKLKQFSILENNTKQAFKDWLQRNPNFSFRQKILQPFLRDISVDFILTHYHIFENTYEQGLVATFNIYFARLDNTLDDTFLVHQHIRDKFNELIKLILSNIIILSTAENNLKQ